MSQIFEKSEIMSLCDWICERGLLRVSLEELLEGVCERLDTMGLPLMRGYITAQTLHPRISVLDSTWRRGEGVSADFINYQAEPLPGFLKSPIKHLLDNGLSHLRVGLEGDEPLPFPICEEFRQQGGTDYLAIVTGFGRDGALDGRTGVISTWVTATPGGFSDDDITLLRYLAPKLAIAVQTRTSQDITVNLLNTYVGSEAGRLILNGEIRRGAVEAISSVILLADLRGFTAVSERAPLDELIETLNEYFDCLVEPIVEHNGNILKFLGDGLLAIFPLNGEPAADLCEHALDAATAALQRIETLKRERSESGKIAMDLDIALHLGDVYWGNVGSAERLDFTIIGPAVNEAARIEALCAQYERDLLVSETFAKAASHSSERLVSIGRFALRGVRSAQSIYTLDHTA